jgi:hypothetical protein
MPEVDTKTVPWQQMMGIFSKYASDLKAEKTLFGQQIYLASLEIKGVDATKKSGACHGLAVRYLEHKHGGGPKDQFLKDMFHLCAGLEHASRPRPAIEGLKPTELSLNDGLAAEKRRGIKKLEASLKGRDADKPAIKAAILEAKRGFDSPEAWVQKLRDNMLTDPLKAVNDDIWAAHAMQHSLNHKESPQSHPGPTKDRLTEKGLEFDQTKTFESYLYRNTKLAAFLAEVEPSYCLIKAPAHAMASVRKDGTLSFFDPNFGEVSFDDPEKFQEFVKTFFNNERVQRNYKGDGQTKILFVVDRYK